MLRFLLMIYLLFFTGCTCFNIPLFEETKELEETVVSGDGRDKILLMDISGVLSTEERGKIVPFREEVSIVSRVREELKKALEDDRIKGLILRVNSPGGTVTSSDIIYREITRFKEENGIPVVACIMELAASGGYYIALAADSIIAHPTSVTGSIGVIALKLNARGLMEKIGIEDETIKAGDKKDLWSPFRPSTEEEKQIIQNMLNDFHRRFKKVVANGRKKLTLEQIEILADGRVFSAEQAVREGLVDRVGYLDDVIEEVKSRAGIARARVVMYHRPYSYKNNVYSQLGNVDFRNINVINLDLGRILDGAGMKFMYLWLP